MNKFLIASVAALIGSAAVAAPVTYQLDPDHTHPSFATDHMGGMSIWRGVIKKSSGTVVLDKEAKTGTVDVTMDMTTIDLGHDAMTAHVKTADMFDVAKFPTATYKGKLAKFNGDTPTEVVGELTLHGVTKPVTLKLNQFTCRPSHPMLKVPHCGADASAMINRADFGINYAAQMGFKMDVQLNIQVEALGPK
jgi:polyisoprenoid-binding protein YceI